MWDLANSPYNLTGTIYVRSGATLTIQSGVQVQSSSGYSLRVNDNGSGGTLVTVGVTFNAQINLGPGSSGTLNSCTFKYSDYNRFDGQMLATVTYCDFSGSRARSQGGGGPINLRNNYWGSTDPSWIAQYKIYDRSDDSSLPVIDFGSPLAAARPTLLVTPVTDTSYGSILVGTTRNLSFTVKNIGTAVISGAATVGVPFSVVGGGSYTLDRGESATTTIRYAPTSPGNHVTTATFTGGSGAAVKLTGSAYDNPSSGTGAISGRVTRVSGGTPVNGATVSVTGPGGAPYPQALTGSDGRYTISGLRAGTQYSVTANPPNGLLLGSSTANGVDVVASQTTMVNLALSSITTPLAATPENTPVVLVRGYGPYREWVDDDSKSWSAVRNALETSGFANVWDCNEPEADIMNGCGHVINGQQGIAWNANSLKVYLRQKSEKYKSLRGSYPPRVHVVAHSMGGLIVRSALGDTSQFIFSHSTPPLRVGKVIMLATPHCGSPVADKAHYLVPLFQHLLGDTCAVNLYGFTHWGSTHDLKTANMRNYNLNSQWPRLPLYIAWASNAGYGYDKSWNGCVDWSPAGKLVIGPWNRDQGVNKTEEDWHDGVVTKPSATGVYWKRDHWWTKPYPVTSIALNPVQTVCDADLGTAVDHLYILKQSGVTDWIAKTLLNPEPTPTPLAAGSLVMRASVRSLDTAGDTERVVQTFESVDGTSTNGTVSVLSVVSDAKTTLTFEFVATDSKTAFRLTDPFGAVIRADTPLTNSNVQYTASMVMSNLVQATFSIADPTSGIWTAIIDATSVTTQAIYNLRVFGDSDVGLIPHTANLFARGQDPVVSCLLADLSTNPVVTVSNASITATVRLPYGATNTFILFDDGWHNDGAPNNGLYAAAMTNAQEEGTYSVTYRAYGMNAQGKPLQRVTTGEFNVSSGNGSILGDPVYDTVNTDGDAYVDFLTVKVWVNPAVTGSYILSGQLVDATGLHNFARTAQFSADTTGALQVTLIFDLAQIGAGAGPGEYHIENLQLFEATAGGTAWLDTYRGSSSTNLPAANPLRVWLAGHGLPSDGSADYVDSDQDGMNNWQEYIAGTDPTNINSFLGITSTSNHPPLGVMGIVVQWSSVTGKWYRLDRGTNLLMYPPFDFNVRSNIPASPPLNTEIDTNATGHGPYFYRIGVQ